MRRVLLGVCLGFLVASVPVWAYRTEKPPTFDHWDSNTFTQLNNILLQLWNATNGRYTTDYLTVTPTGARVGQKGDLVSATFGGLFYICVNTTGTQAAPTKVWKCAQAL